MVNTINQQHGKRGSKYKRIKQAKVEHDLYKLYFSLRITKYHQHLTNTFVIHYQNIGGAWVRHYDPPRCRYDWLALDLGRFRKN